MDPPYRHTIASGDESSMNVQGIQGFTIPLHATNFGE